MKRSMLICWTVLVCLLSFLPALRAQEPRPLVAEPDAPRVNASAGGGVSLSRLMKFTGLLKNRDGSARSGVQGLTFALYREEREGPPLWMETVNVEVDGEGRYTALLGSTKPEGLPLELFMSGEARWLGVRGQMPWDEEQRALLVSVPYALAAANAETLGGRPVSAFVLAEQLNEMVEKAQSSKGGVGVMTAAGGPQGERPDVVYITSGNPGRIAKFTSGTDLGDSVMFESGGRIGVGTTAPISTLHVQTAAASDYLTLSAYQADVFDKGFLVRSARGTPGAPLAVNPGNILFNLYAQGHDGTDYGVSGGITMAVDGTVTTGKVPGAVLFQTADSAGVFAERMRINSAGNVGIGTSSPGARLEVAGPGIWNSSVGIRDTTTGQDWRLSVSGSDFLLTKVAGLTFTPFRANADSFSDALVLASTGVGIGTASPAAKLDVSGNVRSTGQFISTVPTGTAPLVVNSSTQVPNLNASLLGGLPTSAFGDITSVNAGAGLSGGGTAGDVTLSLNTIFSDGRYVDQAGDTMSGALTLPALTASSATAGSPITATNSSGTGANFGVYAQNDSTSGDGVRGFARAATGPAWGAVGISSSSSGIGVHGIATAAATTNFGVRGRAGAASARTFFTQSGVWGDSAAGTGVLATSETNRALVARNNTSAQTVEIRNHTTGGGFLLAAFDAAGTARFWVNNAGSTFATGTKSAMVTLSDGRQVALYAIESPESWFEDFGSGTLNNGRAQITIDPTFVQTVNTEVGYHVYLTANGDCRGLYVAQKGPGFFEVRELGGGQSNVNFDYRIVARRKGHEQARLPQLNSEKEIPKPASEQQPDGSVGRLKEGTVR